MTTQDIDKIDHPFDVSHYLTPNGWRWMISWLPNGQRNWHIAYGETLEEAIKQMEAQP